MNKKSIYLHIASSLAFLVPPPGRFVYGLALVLELNLLMLVGTSFSLLIKKFALDDIESPLYLILLVSFTIFYKQILILTQTGIALTLGFDLYLPVVSSFLIEYLHKKTEATFMETFKTNMLSSLKFSLFALCFYLFRDLVGYGTFTFFGANHKIYEKVIFSPESTSVLSFFATIPGALVLCAVILAAYICVTSKLNILKNARQLEGDE